MHAASSARHRHACNNGALRDVAPMELGYGYVRTLIELGYVYVTNGGLRDGSLEVWVG